MSSSNQTGPSRKSRGRQKVSMVKMENQSNLQVTFSKRRAGLFKKASELCTLCGAEAAIVVFSPAGKAYCFGHPDLKAILEGADPHPADPRSRLVMEAHRNSTIRQLNVELTRAEGLLKAERRRAQQIESPMTCPSLEGRSYEELCMLKESILGFKKKLDAKVHKHMELTRDSGFYSNGGVGFGNGTGLIFDPSRSGGEAPITSSDYNMSSSSFMLPDQATATGGTAFGFSLGHDHSPGFF